MSLMMSRSQLAVVSGVSASLSCDGEKSVTEGVKAGTKGDKFGAVSSKGLEKVSVNNYLIVSNI